VKAPTDLIEGTFPDLGETSASVLARDLERGETLIAHQPRVPTLPASNAKLATAARALAELGPTHRFSTVVHARGERRGETLLGDLVVVATGAPDLSQSDLVELAEQVAAAGIGSIVGEIVVDAAAFDEQSLGPGWTWDDGQFDYGAKSTPLALNRNTVDITVTADDDDVDVNASPTSTVVRIEPDVAVADDGETKLSVYKKRASEVIRIEGSLPAGETAVKPSPVDDPMFHAASVFKSALEQKGIDVNGWIRVESGGVDAGEPIARVESAPVATLVEHTLHRSDNFYAEQLARAVAREVSGDGSWAVWEDHVTGFIDKLGGGPVRLRDGSGLSRYNLLSAHGVVSVLEWSRTQPWGERFYESLPRAGVEGTVATRLEGLPVTVRAKTGTLTGARALSGFVDRDGQPQIVFSCLLSSLTDAHEPAAVDRIDAFVRELVSAR